jgi:hypothetical protein
VSGVVSGLRHAAAAVSLAALLAVATLGGGQASLRALDEPAAAFGPVPDVDRARGGSVEVVHLEQAGLTRLPETRPSVPVGPERPGELVTDRQADLHTEIIPETLAVELARLEADARESSGAPPDRQNAGVEEPGRAGSPPAWTQSPPGHGQPTQGAGPGSAPEVGPPEHAGSGEVSGANAGNRGGSGQGSGSASAQGNGNANGNANGEAGNGRGPQE